MQFVSLSQFKLLMNLINNADKLASTIPCTNEDATMCHVPQLRNSFSMFPTNPNKIQNVICGFESIVSHIKWVPCFIYKQTAIQISPLDAKQLY